MSYSPEDIFHQVTELPNSAARSRAKALVGLDTVKERLVKEARILLNPGLLREWSQRHYGHQIRLVANWAERLPLFIFAGDVGTGKTALAETFGDVVAREEDIPITLYTLGLSVRGSGAVGEMTKLISTAFREVCQSAHQATRKDGKPSAATIFVIDEADTLAQSREISQMHHEDRAGVNSLIRGLDDIARNRLPVIVVMCTNRVEAIDPAVRRRAVEIFGFQRPDDKQRVAVLRLHLSDAGWTDEQIRALAKVTGPTEGRQYGHTYSDIVQRLLPALLLDAFPQQAIEFDRAIQIARSMSPTPPFNSELV